MGSLHSQIAAKFAEPLAQCKIWGLLQEKGQGHLVEKLPKSLGNSLGLELRESGTLLNAKNSATAKAGMVFNLTLGAWQC